MAPRGQRSGSFWIFYLLFTVKKKQTEWYETPQPETGQRRITSDAISDIVSLVNESNHFVVTIGTDTRKTRSTALRR